MMLSDIILDICFSPQMGQPIAPDGGNLAKLYSMSPAVLGHGQTVIETEGPIWVSRTSCTTKPTMLK